MMQLGGITLPVLLGYRLPLPQEAWGLLLGVAYLGLSLRLMASGFADQPADDRPPDAWWKESTE